MTAVKLQQCNCYCTYIEISTSVELDVYNKDSIAEYLWNSEEDT